MDAIEPEETSTAIQKVLKIEKKAIIEEGENSETEADFSSNEMTTTEPTTLEGGDTASTKTTSVTDNGGSSSSSENAPTTSSDRSGGGSGSSSTPAPTSNTEPISESDDAGENEEKPPKTDPISPNNFLLKEKFAITFTLKEPKLKFETSNVFSGEEVKIKVTSGGKPVEGALVKCLNMITETDKYGISSFKTPLSLTGSHIFQITKEGYNSVNGLIEIVKEKPTEHLTSLLTQPADEELLLFSSQLEQFPTFNRLFQNLDRLN